MSYAFDIEGAFPTKKNSYIICRDVTKGRRFIMPSPKAKAAVELIAWKARQAIPHDIDGPIKVSVGVFGRRRDLDNVCGSVMDGLELSGRIGDDRQVDELHAKRIKGSRKDGCVVAVEEL
tara:strand:- start:472 stop:831 length:360 start_codon:yes stop_codon:yes gene_type:complete